MPPRTFLEDITWVNKTSANFRTRSRREAHVINSHINGSYARWKRKEVTRTLKAASRSLPFDEDELAEERRTSSNKILFDNADSWPASSTDTSTDVSPGQETSLIPLGSIANTHSVLCRGNSDPFDTTAIPLTALNNHCHRLAREFQVGSIWAEEMDQDELRSATVNWWLADGTMLESTTAMHALMAWAYSSRLSMQAYPPRQIALRALEYKTDALRELQYLVTNLTSFERHCAAFDAMLFLAASEWTARNPTAVMAHMKSAYAIVQSMGGFDMLPGPKKESSLWMFVTLCFHFAVRPLVRPHEIDPGPLSAYKIFDTPVMDNIRRSLRVAVYRRTAGTTISALAGSTLVSLWEAMSEARHVVDLIRGDRILPRDVLSGLNRWLFLRKLATRTRVEHLWHDLKLALKDSSVGQATRSDAVTSQYHLNLWQICMCMASRIFDELVFEKLHPGDDVRGHWTPYYLRYLPHLRMLEQAEARSNRQTSDRGANADEECQMMRLWLYFMGASVEELVFGGSLGRPIPKLPGLEEELSCSQRFKKLYESSSYLRECSIAATFEEKLLFAPNVLQRVLDMLLREVSYSD